MKKIFAILLAVMLLAPTLCGIVSFAEDKKLTVEKTDYTVNEPIMVSATGSGKDWVGIYEPGKSYSLYWAYVDANANKGIGSGVAFDITKAPNKSGSAPVILPAGEYIIRLMPNDSSDISQQLDSVTIRIRESENTDEQDTAVSGGDLTKLNVPKTEYGYYEEINISAIGSGKDWVGIYTPNATASLYWTYIDTAAYNGVGSGVEFDMRKVANKKDSAPKTLPAGEYIIRLLPNNSDNIADTIAWVKITIRKEDPSEITRPEKPISAEYVLADNTDGYSEGTVTVTLSKENTASDIVCYWANENGKLEGYTALSKFKVTDEKTVGIIPANILIPEGATKLLVYTSLGGFLSEDCIEIPLPDGAASNDFGKPLFEFQVVSDIHLYENNNHTHNKNFSKMLKDIVATSPESIGLFICGDIANMGRRQEYEALLKLYAEIEDAPPYYMAIGNHDLYEGEHAEKVAQFLSYAKLPDGTHPDSVHYDFWLHGYHYVFLGNDKLVESTRVTLNEETLKWLDETLAEDREEGRATFLFLHQSIYNTIAGSLPGQGWDGVIEREKLEQILSKYPEVIMFNGHSHWTLDSERCMYDGGELFPTIFNTASVAYLWSSYNITKGEHLDGSHGYYIRVYEDKVAVLGRDFITGEWVSSAQFIVESKAKNNEDPDNEPTDTTPDTQPAIPNVPNVDTNTDNGKTPSSAWLIALGAVVAVAALTVVVVLIMKKKK